MHEAAPAMSKAPSVSKVKRRRFDFTGRLKGEGEALASGLRKNYREFVHGSGFHSTFDIRHLTFLPMPDEPIIDLQSDHYFMGEALRQAAKAYEAEEVPVGAVVVREGRIIGRAYNQVELLKDATAHAEMLALTQAEEAVGDWRLSDCTLYV